MTKYEAFVKIAGRKNGDWIKVFPTYNGELFDSRDEAEWEVDHEIESRLPHKIFNGKAWVVSDTPVVATKIVAVEI